MSARHKYAVAKAAYDKALAEMQKARSELNAELIERRIAGKTNKEIAAELGLTVNFVNQSTTVEYRKAGGRVRMFHVQRRKDAMMSLHNDMRT